MVLLVDKYYQTKYYTQRTYWIKYSLLATFSGIFLTQNTYV